MVVHTVRILESHCSICGYVWRPSEYELKEAAKGNGQVRCRACGGKGAQSWESGPDLSSEDTAND